AQVRTWRTAAAQTGLADTDSAARRDHAAAMARRRLPARGTRRRAPRAVAAQAAQQSHVAGRALLVALVPAGANPPRRLALSRAVYGRPRPCADGDPRQAAQERSEERRVGKECRSRWSP